MLPRLQRYPLRSDRTFFTTAQKHFFPGFLVYIKAVPDLEKTSQATVVVKKNVGSAVVRNALKRKVHSSLSPLLSQHPGKAVVCVLSHNRFTDETIAQILEKVLKH